MDENLTKVCSRCGKEKSWEEFDRCKKNKSGLKSNCKQCRNEYAKKWYQKNKERASEQNKQWMKDNKKQRQEYMKKWRQENKENISEYNKQWTKENKEYINKSRNNRYEVFKKTDPIYCLRRNISGAINRALKRNKGGKDGESVLKYLPYTIEELKKHLENHPEKEDWMTWKNHGVFSHKDKNKKWHIDHIIPQDSLLYDSMKHPNFKKCWALENLRPLEAIENIKKGNKIS